MITSQSIPISEALVRRREIKTAEDLLKLDFLYLTEGKSFGGTAVLFSIEGKYKLNKTAVYERIKGSNKWLQWMCENLCRQSGTLAEKPGWLEGKEVYAVDASDEPVYGSKKADYRLHYALDLFNLDTKEMYLTDTRQGEKISNFKTFGKGDVVIGDRCYLTIAAMEHLGVCGSDFVLRMRFNAFNIYNREGQKISLSERFRHLGPGESGDTEVFYNHNGENKAIRICALRKTKEQEEEAMKRIEGTRQRKNLEEASEELKEFNRYVILATSLTGVKASAIMELYRQRWQIEMLFKRLKTLFKYNEIPSKLDESARAWFYGKLLLAAFCETWVNKGRFSP